MGINEKSIPKCLSCGKKSRPGMLIGGLVRYCQSCTNDGYCFYCNSNRVDINGSGCCKECRHINNLDTILPKHI